MSALDKTRSRFALKKGKFLQRPKDALRIKPPSWFEEVDEHRFDLLFRDEQLLYTEGKIVEAYLVQANTLLFEPRDDDDNDDENEDACPAVIVFSHDPHFEECPEALAEIAHTLFSYKNREVDIPELQPFIAQITNHRATDWSRELPLDVTGGRRVYFSVILVFRKHLPAEYLMASRFPILTAPQHTSATMILPCRFWDDEYLTDWMAEETPAVLPLRVIAPSEDSLADLVVFFEEKVVICELSYDEDVDADEDIARIVKLIERGADPTRVVDDSTPLTYDAIRKVRANATTRVMDIKYESDDEEETALVSFESVATQREAFERLAAQTKGRLHRKEVQLSRVRAAMKPLFILGFIVALTLIFRLAALQCIAGECSDDSWHFIRNAFGWVLAKLGPRGVLAIGSLLFAVTTVFWAVPRLKNPPLLRLLLPANSREVVL